LSVAATADLLQPLNLRQLLTSNAVVVELTTNHTHYLQAKIFVLL